jgi:hypothetical protein
MIVSPRPEVLKAVNDKRKVEDRARKQKKAELKEQKAAAAVVGTGGSVIAEINGLGSDDISMDMNGSFDDDDDDDDDTDDVLDDIEADIESSLDDLFGSDDLTDDLFS